jgi:galactokinase
VPVAVAPGRVNLIGDHTDYQDGLCMPMAIDRAVRVTFAGRSDGAVRVRSDAADDGSQRIVDAVIDVLDGTLAGFDATVTSTIPTGAGLSSSAAFEVAVALAAADVAGIPLEGRALARAAQEAEHRASGVPCGIMDQMACVFGRAGHALLLDCRTLEVKHVALPEGVAVVVVHSGVARRLDQSAYAERRAACEAAAARLGVPALRDATIDQVRDDPIARHVVSENGRVLAYADAFRTGDLARAGALMLESHASLRDDFAVSIPELDDLVSALVDAGAYGARLTGAGFGGCVVALVDAAQPVPEIGAMRWVVHAADGAHIE